MCLGDRQRLLALAVKVEDGARRAIGPAVIEFLAACGILSESETIGLAEEHVGTVENTRGEIVGEVRARIRVRGPFGSQG
jgi:L-asparaginase II